MGRRPPLPDGQVLEILRLHLEGVKPPRIAVRFDRNADTIRSIIAGDSHAHVVPPDHTDKGVCNCVRCRCRYGKRRWHPPRALTGPQALEVVALAGAGMKQRAIAEKFGVSLFLVNSLLRGLIYADVTGLPPQPRKRRARPAGESVRVENRRRVREAVVVLRCGLCREETPAVVGAAMDGKYRVTCGCEGRH